MPSIPTATVPQALAEMAAGRRADRAGYRSDSAPLNAPITAAFIGLLLLREAHWIEPSEAQDLAADGADPTVVPPAQALVDKPANGDAVQTGAEDVWLPTAPNLEAGLAPAAGTLEEPLADGGEAVDVELAEGAGPQVLAEDGGTIQLGDLSLSSSMETSVPEFDIAAEPELTVGEDLGPTGDYRVGGDGDDRMVGSDYDDKLFGNGGHDDIDGGAGNDDIDGGVGDDRLRGGRGHDTLTGGDGDDWLFGGAGIDTVVGGAGDDTLRGGVADGGGVNFLHGEAGDDTYVIHPDVDAYSTILDRQGISTIRVVGADLDDITSVAAGPNTVTLEVNGVALATLNQYDPGGSRYVIEADDGTRELNAMAPVVTTALPRWYPDTVNVFDLPSGLFEDYDPGDALTLSATLGDGSPLPKWLTFDASQGRFEADMADAELGSYTVRVVATDKAGHQAATTFAMDVESWNAPPEPDVVPTPPAAAEGEAFLWQVPEQTFTDPDGDVLLLRAELENGAPLPAWLEFDPGTQALSGMPGATDAGTYRVALWATDPGGLEARTVVTLEVTGLNVAPEVVDVYSDAPVGLVEGDTFDLSPDGHFSDADGDVLALLVTTADGDPLPNWLAYDPATFELTIVPSADAAEFARDAGRIELRVAARDPAGQESSPIFLELDIEPLADLLTTPPATITAFEDEALVNATLTGRFTEAEGAELKATLVGGGDLPAWLTFDPATGTFAGTPATDDIGVIGIEVTATDAAGHVDRESFTLVVENTNDAPFASDVLADLVVAEGAEVFITLPEMLFDDIDLPHGDELTLTASGLPTGLFFDAATGKIVGTAPALGTDQTFAVTVRATDRAGAEADVSFGLTIEALNEAPEVGFVPAPPSALEGQPYAWQIPAGTFDDPDGDALAFTVKLADGAPLPAWMSFDPETRVLLATPGDAAPGTYALELAGSDPGGLSATTVVTLKVHNINDHPIAVDEIADQQVGVGRPMAPIDVTDAFTDADLPHGDSLTFSATGAGGAALPEGLSFDGGTLSGSPQTPGSHEIRIVARDSEGAEAEATFTLTVDATNAAPTVGAAPLVPAAVEDDAYAWQLPEGVFADPDGDTLAFEAKLAGGAPLPDWLSFDPATRLFFGTPGDAAPGTYEIEVKATDPGGLTASATLQLTVGNTNDAPVVADAIEGQVLAFGEAMQPVEVATGFADADLAFGDELVFTATGAEGGALPAGLVFDGATLSGSPLAAGSHEIRVVARDAAGAEVAQTFSLSVAPGSAAADVVLGSDGTIPASVLPAGGVFDFDSHPNMSRFYKLTDDELPREFVDDVGGAQPIRLPSSYQHVELGSVNADGLYARIVMGGDEDNIVLGDNARDLLIGGAGDDVLSGGAADDELHGGAGDDVLAGGRGADLLHGGTGSDRYEIGGLSDGAVDTIYDEGGDNVVDFDGVDADQMRFGMDGADLVIAVDGATAVRIDGFEAGEARFDVETDDGLATHADIVAALAEELRAASQAEPLADVLDGWIDRGAAAAVDDPTTMAVAEPDAPELDLAPPPAAVIAEAAPFDLPAGVQTHEEGASGLAGKTADEEQPTFA